MYDVRANDGVPIAAYFSGVRPSIVLDVSTGDAYSLKTGDEVMRIGGPAEASATVNTTDGTQTTIATISISTTTLIYATVLGRRTGGTSGSAGDSAAYIVCACYKKVGDTATEVGETSVFTAEDQAGWGCTVTASGGNALIRVTGAADNNVTWVAYYKTYSV